MIYLDNAATTPVWDDVAEVIYNSLREDFGNPSALYNLGFQTQKKLDEARSSVAKAFGCSADRLFFTGCGTEGNNIAILGGARARKAWGKKVIVTGYEHPSVALTVDSLADEGFNIIKIDPGTDGKVDPDDILEAVDSGTVLVAMMRVNNETGSMLDVSSIAGLIHKKNKRTAVHCDNVQGFMKHSLDLNNIDTVSVSAHKIHGPKGIGALYIRKGFNLISPSHGGGQEHGYRSGTENVPYALGFAEAVKKAGNISKNLEKAAELNGYLRNRLSGCHEVIINSPSDASPYILNISVPGYRSETMLHFLEMHDIYVSSGSACSKGERSYTLTAMKLPDNVIDSALRISFSYDSKLSDVEAFADALTEGIKILVNTSKR